MIRQPQNLIFIILGWSALCMGLAGIFLPILPSTPFAILAAYFFSKGSPRLHKWLLSTRHLGPLIRAWEEHGVISLKAKLLATLMIVLLFSYTLIFVDVLIWIKSIVAATGVGVLAFLWTRPSKIRTTNTFSHQ